MHAATVKNIAEFGAFIDLGRHRRPAAHHRHVLGPHSSTPARSSSLGRRVEVKILNIDRDREKIALGLKQKEASPWERDREEVSPVGSRVKGAVVNIMSYGAFVRLEDGIEGLVHISEMSLDTQHPAPERSRAASGRRG